MNRIWGHAGIHFPIATLTTEAAALPMPTGKLPLAQPSLDARPAPPTTRTPDHFHVYYLKRFLANGVYIGPGGMFVKDMAKLWKVENGIEKPIPRVTSHELGHALTLKHRQEATNLMASGTSGWTLNEAEIEQSRAAAQKLKWIRPAKEILAQADGCYVEENAPKPRTIPAHRRHPPALPRNHRAKLRLKPQP